MTNRVREIRTPGSVGALGGNPQSDPACAKKAQERRIAQT